MTVPSHQIALYVLYVVLTVGALLALGYGGYRYYVQTQDTITTLQSRLASTTQALTNETNARETLTAHLLEEQQKNGTVASQLNTLVRSVHTLDKLSKTDPELLKKYSKVFFLSEHYLPATTTPIESTYLSDPSRTTLFQAQAYPYLARLLNAAADEGLKLRVASGYRSFATQKNLKSSYKVTYGTGANAFSADQGYSEHQLGTAIDVTTPSIGGALTGFDKTPEYTWLTTHAYRYGFILSYPKGNGYYTYEPWHWRFVGVDLATTLHDDNQYFYDLDQRTIDSYLIYLFDE